MRRQHRAGLGLRRDHVASLRRYPKNRPRHDPRHRVHAFPSGLRRRRLRGADRDRRAVARHQAERGPRPRNPRRRSGSADRRRRPGHGLRLRPHRHRRLHAAADPPRPPHLPEDGGSAQSRQHDPRTRREIDGHDPVRRPPADAHRHGRRLDAAQRGSDARSDRASDQRKGARRRAARRTL